MLLLALLALPVPAGARHEIDLDEGNYADIEIEVLEREAMQGGLKAAYFLGLRYRDGKGVTPPDPERALEWLKKAGEPWNVRMDYKQGLDAAQYAAGVMYRDGVGTARNPQEAVVWLLRAARQGHSQAQLALAELYLRDSSAGIDHTQAYFWSSVALGALSGEEKSRARAVRAESAKSLGADEIRVLRKVVNNWTPESD
ncbi:MAG: sel1 repeat family protein [Betaproteobacteria bacterium]|nr:sel1 repeat family protein [Betaproteobacteria bacterium]